MFGFKKNNNNTDSVPAPVVAAARQFGETTKKKNTYVIQLDNLLAQPELLGGCREMPLPVVKTNGVSSQATGVWMRAKSFPNPAAHDMVVAFKQLKPIMNETASTIIEYLDKETGVPVVQLYPTMAYIMTGFEDNYMSRLNHASRRDFMYQLNKRRAAVKKVFGNLAR